MSIWTDARVDQLRMEAAKGSSAAKIAKALGDVSGEAVNKRLQKLNINNGYFWTDARIEQLKQLAYAGLSSRQIAREIGISRNAAIGKLGRLGVPLTSGSKYLAWPKTRVAKLKELLAENLTYKQIAEDLSITEKAVQRKIDRLGGGPGRVKPKAESRPQFHCKPATYVEPPSKFIPISQRRTLMELTSATCRWPVGDPRTPDFFFCGAQTETERPYCPHHCGIAYTVPEGPMRRRPYYGVAPDRTAQPMPFDLHSQIRKASVAKRTVSLPPTSDLPHIDTSSP